MIVILTMTISGQSAVARIHGDQMRTAGFKHDLVTEEDLEEMAKAWEEWKEKDDAVLALSHGQIYIKK